MFTGFIAKSFGASKSWLVDHGSFATLDPSSYISLCDYLSTQGYQNSLVSPFDSSQDFLDSSNISYLTHGISSLSQIPDNKVDFCFSNAVLEHIPCNDFPLLAAELFRILKPTGICVHRIDLKDHIGGALNNLRFSDLVWESSLP